MTAPNRAARIAKTYKVLKQHYKPCVSPENRPLLEHLLYACCLENASFEAADEGFARLQQAYFDWNEIRVTTVSELAETMSCLPDAAEAASRLKRCLQGVFETYYAFDIEFLKKQSIGKAVAELRKHPGVTPFGIAYVTQHGLGGHAIPTNRSAIEAMLVLGVVTTAEAQKGRVPGLERAIGKTNGIEFGSLLHQFAADFAASPFSPRVRAIFVEIDPESKQRLPKRGARKAASESGSNASPNGGSPAPSDSPSGRRSSARKKETARPRKTAPPPEKKGGAGPDSGSRSRKSVTKRIARKKPR